MADSPVKVYLFAWRKPDITPEQFKTHYEETHIPLVKSLSGSLWPISHTRHYMTWFMRPDAENNPKVDLDEDSAEAQKNVQFDVYAELVFSSATALAEFTARAQEPESAERLAADEKLFLDRKKMSVGIVADVHVTTAD